MNILILGDVYGRPGRSLLKNRLNDLINEYNIDFTVVNGENASGGNGLTTKNARELLALSIDAMTMGNHVWQHKDLLLSIDQFEPIVRPLNYPEPCPGKGIGFYQCNGKKIAVINLSGQIYMPSLNCPFNTIKPLMESIKDQADIIIVDFHAEATSEKIAMGYFLDGWATVVYGTHTHVQTADGRLLENQTAYITDVGMTGPIDGVIGVEKEIILETMLNKRPKRFETANGAVQVNGIVVSIDHETNLAKSIQRVYKVFETV
ncbi:TIGR00282 family metallophosphoesterase [Eubacteriaceae bacterium ES3]|nr:TIGR00282 family metallophosphoesterase [Eubacteriaceae bacterium ES3]